MGRRTADNVFPSVLHEMLEHCHQNGLDNIVSWNASGKSFKVHNRERFMNEVLPAYASQTKYKSFVRQLNLWGFSCIHGGRKAPERGSYQHKFFVRGKYNLCRNMKRVTVKGKSIKRQHEQPRQELKLDDGTKVTRPAKEPLSEVLPAQEQGVVLQRQRQQQYPANACRVLTAASPVSATAEEATGGVLLSSPPADSWDSLPNLGRIDVQANADVQTCLRFPSQFELFETDPLDRMIEETFREKEGGNRTIHSSSSNQNASTESGTWSQAPAMDVAGSSIREMDVVSATPNISHTDFEPIPLS